MLGSRGDFRPVVLLLSSQSDWPSESVDRDHARPPNAMHDILIPTIDLQPRTLLLFENGLEEDRWSTRTM